MGPSLSRRMLSLAIWYTSTIHDASPHVIALGGGLPARPVQAYHARVPRRPQSSSAHRFIVKGWRAGSDVITSNTGRDHGSQKRQTSEAISAKTQSATPHALLRSASVAQPRPRLAALPQHAGTGQSSWYR